MSITIVEAANVAVITNIPYTKLRAMADFAMAAFAELCDREGLPEPTAAEGVCYGIAFACFLPEYARALVLDEHAAFNLTNEQLAAARDRAFAIAERFPVEVHYGD